MARENLPESNDLGLYPIQRLLPDLESGEKEIVPGKRVIVRTHGRMSLIPKAELRPPVKHIDITICEACNQFQTDVRAQITTHGEPKVLFIAIRLAGKTLVLFDEQKDMLNRDKVREIERDLKAYLKLKEKDVAPAVERILTKTRDAATQAEADEVRFDNHDRRGGRGRR
ncbi:MAG: hypothetical protein NTX63_01230 [Candidatus Peregrinibacteria bacterium]|nr:hypothetical protein [Candidatus Peregrinibacteria bacterium]